jgi:eukaryotic-like serine/threonine-protein kinase
MYGPGALLANRYRLDERVGGGGMGEVWRATDEVLGRTVAVKVMRPELLEERGFAERFLTEARTMATIKHRGVVAVHDYQGDPSGAFLVMEYVDGESLSRRLHRFGKLDPVRTMSLVAQAAEALQAAHDKGVVHRDIKPGNLLVTADDTLVLTDFGIARSAASTPLTATGAVIGTPSYLAPEQVLGKPASPLSDIYALGVVAYECLTGRRPFDGDNPFEIAMKRLREPPPTMTGDVPIEVLAVVDRALAADGAQRWPSASALASAARGAMAPATSAPATRAAPTSPVPTSPAAWSGAGNGGFGLGGGVASPAPGGYAPGRMAVPDPRHSAPTRLDTPAPTPPPGSPFPTPTPPPGSPPSMQYTVPPPPPRPSAPVTLILASLLLCVAALSLSVYSLATLSVLDDVNRIAEEELGYNYYVEDWQGVTIAAGWITVGSVAVMALLFLLFALLNARGSRSSRAWTIVFGIFALCCCGPSTLFLSADRFADNPNTDDFAEALTEELGWYQSLAGQTTIITMLALLAAMVLLMVPPTNRYFRSFRPVPRGPYYYPQQYPQYPYPPYR